MIPPRPVVTCSVLVLLAACASAGKRLEQGLEAERAGSFYEASMRYVEALEKDADLTQARERLVEAGDSAVVAGLIDVEADLRAGDDVAAAEGFRILDRLLARARSVGVRIPVPDDYALRRRQTFDGAIEALLDASRSDGERERWGAARSALTRIRRDFDASAEQRRRSEEAEALLLLDWADAEAESGHLRRSYDLAEEALGAADPPPDRLAEAAEALQARAVAEGSRAIAVLEVTATAPVRDRMESDLDRQLSDLLELNHWREPPLFVLVVDPVLVRQAVRRRAPPGTPLRAGRILDDVGADFGVIIELTDLAVSERDIRREVHEARTADGRRTSWTEERGTLSVTLETRVTVVDGSGRRVLDARRRADQSGRFERGIYRGDPRELDLSRGERLLFDPLALRRARAEIEQKVVEVLAEHVADQVFSGVLAHIP